MLRNARSLQLLRRCAESFSTGKEATFGYHYCNILLPPEKDSVQKVLC